MKKLFYLLFTSLVSCEASTQKQEVKSEYTVINDTCIGNGDSICSLGPPQPLIIDNHNARVRSYPVFSSKDTSSTIAWLKAGDTIIGYLPEEFRRKIAQTGFETTRLYHWQVRLKKTDGSETIGYIASWVVSPIGKCNACPPAPVGTPYGEKIILKGTYKGKNLFIQNPFSNHGGLCVSLWPEVNGDISNRLVSSSAFEINLEEYNFKTGDPVEIVIKHDGGCTPKVLNPEVIMPDSTGKK